MDGDRWSYLAVRAFTLGLLNFSADEREDERWQLREQLLLAEVERDIQAELNKLLHVAEVSITAELRGEAFKRHYAQVCKLYRRVARLLYPYRADRRTDKEIDDATAQRMMQAWVDAYGDLDSEAVHETIDWLKKEIADAKQRNAGAGRKRRTDPARRSY